MRPIYGIWIVLSIGLCVTTPAAQRPVDAQFWPKEFVVGMRNPIITGSASGLRRDSVFQINGRTITTNSTHVGQFGRLEAEVPTALLATPGILQISLYTPPPNSWRSPITEIRVVPSKQSNKIEISLPKTRVGPREKLTLTVRVTNLGTESFYVPVKIEPGSTGNMLDSSYALEVKRPNARSFVDAATSAADGVYTTKPTEEELVQAGEIVAVRPGETYTGTGDLYVDSVFDWFTNRPAVQTPGRYAIRILFSPRTTPGADQFKIKFLRERAVSNVVWITVLR
jgi:hypothetical protein